jgi:predicted NBD/HSP70 family sugar kinase
MQEIINTGNLRLRILNILRNQGPATKRDIAQALGINLTTVSKLVNDLFFSGNYIKVAGDDDSSGGRKPKLYALNNAAGYVIGIDIGGENLRFMLTDICGCIIKSYKKENKIGSSREKMINEILENINKICEVSQLPQKRVLGIGISISGIIDSNTGVSLYCPNIDGLNNFEVKKYFENKTGMHFFIDDSVRCMTIAEKHYGAAKSYDNFLFVGLGKGIGLGIYVNGKIYRGSNGLAGELGHITVSEDGPVCNCGNKGCLEAIASSSGIVKRAAEGMNHGIITSLSSIKKGDYSALTVEDIAEAAKSGDKFAYSIINRTGEYIGIAIATALNLFGTELVVLGGGISMSGNIMLDAIKRTVQIRALEVVSKKVRIIRSELDEFNAAWGAATKYINVLFTDGEYDILKMKI